MSGAHDVLSLYAELSLGLAGFVGVVSAFSGRDRVFQPIEKVRVMHVLGCAGSVLAGRLDTHDTLAIRASPAAFPRALLAEQYFATGDRSRSTSGSTGSHPAGRKRG